MAALPLLLSPLLLLLLLSPAEGRGWFVQLTDSHLHKGYRAGSSNSAENLCIKGTGSVGPFGDLKCDSPAAALASAWEEVIRIAAERSATPPDFLLWTGDHVSNVDPDSSEKATEFCLKDVSDALHAIQKKLPASVKVFPVIGNHDSYPKYQFPKEGPYFVYETAATLWADWLSAESLVTLRKGGFYTELLNPGSSLRIVALNTNIYYQYNRKVDVSVKDPAGQLAWLRKVLENARKAGENVFIITHLPVGWDHFANYTVIKKEFHERLLDTINGFSDVIVGSFCGHMHYDSFRVVTDSAANAGSSHVWWTTSAITAHPSQNPSITVFEYNRTKPFGLLDKVVTYFDLAKANANGTAIVWKELYRASSLYGLKDLSAASMADFVHRMKSDKNLFNSWYRKIKTDIVTHKCDDDACRKMHLCMLTNFRYAAAAKCMEK